MVNSFNKVFLGAAGTPTGASDDQFNRVSFLSHFDGANNGVNNAFDDGSTNNHTVTANGNVTQGSFGPLARPDGEWAVSFDGAGDYLTINEGATGGSGNWTIEMFINPSNVGSGQFGTLLDNRPDSTNGLYQTLVLDAATLKFYVGGSGASYRITSGDALTANTWFHVALCKSGSSTKLFIDGTQTGSTFTDNVTYADNNRTLIGAEVTFGAGIDEFFNGQISNFRIVNSALYAGNFTAPTSKLTAVSNTAILTCQSNRLVDNSGNAHTVTPSGGAAVTAFGPFLTSSVYSAAVNGASAYFDGNGDYLSAEDDANFSFGTGDFTVECWLFHQNASATFYDIMGTANNLAYVGSNRGGWILAYYHTYGSGTYAVKFGYQYNNSFPVDVAFSKTLNADGWYHLTISRQGNQLKCFVNGIQAGSTVTNSTNMISTEPLIVGKGSGASNSGPMTGYICDARVVKGTAVYTSNFTPPTAPLTAITNTKLLLNMADGQAIDSAAQNILTLYGNANTSTDQTKFGDTSLHLDGTGDYAALSGSHVFGTGDYTIEMFVYHTSVSGQQTYFSDVYGNTAGVYFYKDSNHKLGLYYSDQIVTGSGNVPANQWVHVSVCRASGTSRLFLNGALQGSASDTTNLTQTAYSIGDSVGTSSGEFIGYIDEVRVSKMARYTANFTAPTEPFADKGQ